MFFDKVYRTKKRLGRLLKIMNLPEAGSVLDVSCADGQLLRRIHASRPELELHGVDVSEDAINDAKKLYEGINFKQTSSEALPYPDQTFNVVICSSTLHHYKNPEKVFAEIRRVMKSGADLYLLDIAPQNKLTQFLYNLRGCPEPYHFEKFYTKKDVTQIAQQQNFSVTQVHKVKSLPRLAVYKFK